MTDKERILRLEKAVNCLAWAISRHQGIPTGLSPELDSLRKELHGSINHEGIVERRPHVADETRAA